MSEVLNNDKRYTVPSSEALFHVKYKKKRTNYSIREDILHDFNKYTDEQNLNKSAVLETFMKNFLLQVGVRKT